MNILARNEEYQRLRAEFIAANPRKPDEVAVWNGNAAEYMRAVEAAEARYAVRVGLRQFEKPISDYTFRKHGFEPVAEGGWRAG
jgi:hypothetical protein